MTLLCLLLVILRTVTSSAGIRAQDVNTPNLDPVMLDVLDGNRWSETSVVAAPDQTIRITNRSARQHTFTVTEWGVDLIVPSLESVDIRVPAGAEPGASVTFFCNEPGHRALGEEGTITIISVDDARAAQALNQGGSDDPRIVLETGDDFEWSVPGFEVGPGDFIELRNPGVIEHHFVVDEWNINETVSPGDVVLVQVPLDATIGATFIFYCSMPGHRAGGEEGVITIVAQTDSSGRGPGNAQRGPTANDFGRFLPEAADFGSGWEQVRTGDARAVIDQFDTVSTSIFPGTGRGATYVGPAGSRATVLVLPFSPFGVPSNQVEDAVLTVQLMMMNEWETDLLASEPLNELPPPVGCDTAVRTTGVTRVYSLPAGSTVCELKSAGIAVFVTIEGAYGEWIGVEAADEIVARLLEGA